MQNDAKQKQLAFTSFIGEKLLERIKVTAIGQLNSGSVAACNTGQVTGVGVTAVEANDTQPSFGSNEVFKAEVGRQEQIAIVVDRRP